MSKYKIIISSETDYYRSIEFCFGKDSIENFTPNEKIATVKSTALKLLKVKSVIFYTLSGSNDILFNMLPKNTKKYVIFPYSVTELSDPQKINELLLILRYINMKIIDGVYCLDYNAYSILHNKYNFKYLQLYIETNEKANSKTTIGLIAKPKDYYNTVVNELSAITLTKNRNVRMYKPLKVVESFAKRFGIKISKEKLLDDTIRNNNINLYINFSATCYTFILESMDMGIPCIVGNTDFFDDNKLLKEYLVMKSDDDINEMKERIELVENNKEIILNEYQEFRKKYKKIANKSIENFKNEIK